jgi:hypothetical protein
VKKVTLVRGIKRTGCHRLLLLMSTCSSIHFLENQLPFHVLDLPLVVFIAWFLHIIVGIVYSCIYKTDSLKFLSS